MRSTGVLSRVTSRDTVLKNHATRRWKRLLFALLATIAWPTIARAQTPPASASAAPAPAPADPDAGALVEGLTPPSLKARVEAAYPADALRDRIEGTVGLELTVDVLGDVTDAQVTTSAGHGFDEAALAAAKKFVFEPAKENGIPIASSVQFAYEFHLPPPAPPPQVVSTNPAAPPAAAPSPVQTGADQSTLVLAQRPISAASAFSVQARDFELRPIGSVQDILRVTPGLVMVQHSGGGKANQYFLRGFDADHGTDIALSIDGIPINMVSHAHGQGFSDTNFIIPEVVERVEITKGPYFADQGDFDTAGSVNLVTRENMEHSSLGFGVGGSPGNGGPSYRGLVVASPVLSGPGGGTIKTLFAAELGRQDGPFENPEQWDKYKLFNKVTFVLTNQSSLTLGESSYASSWHGSGQIPSRAVDNGLINRFGSIDPTEGGDTGRHQIFVTYKLRPTEKTQLDALVYAGTYRFDLYSNFTLYLDDPMNGDEIEQMDRRVFYGGKASYKIRHDIGTVRTTTTIGAQVRNDDIHEELWHTRERIQLSQERGNDVHESLVGVYANEEVQPVKWLRVVGGLRGDYLGFSVDNRVDAPGAPRSGEDGAHQFSPKASVIVSPIDRKNAQLDLYANYGNGFHSNDVRGVFASPSVTPLTRAIGEEAGARTRLFDRWDFAAALWRLNLDQETVWGGDDGTTGVSDATLRHGVEFESRLEITKWLAADGALTFTHSQFSTDNENGGGLALAPKQTWSGGLSARHELGPGALRGGLRFYGIGDRPASDDGAIIAPGFTQLDLHVGYRTRRFDVALDIENLLNGAFRSAQFDTVSRLRNEPAIGTPLNQVPAGLCGSNGRVASGANGGFGGCEGVDYTPAYPITARLMTTLYLD